MKFKKSIIIILLLMALIAIPISFASDVQSTSDIQSGFESSQISETNDLAINDNLEENLDDEILDYNNDLEKNILESNDEGSQSEVSSSSNSDDVSSSYNNDLPDLDTGFSQIEINCNDENTVFVNASYEGEDENGTQANPFKTIQNAFNYISSHSEKTNIFLAEGRYNISSRLYVFSSLNIIGENSANTIISGSNQTNLLHVSSYKKLVNIINLTLSNGLNHQGGAIYAENAYLNIINTIFYNNHAYDISSQNTGEGGAIYNNASFIKIYNSTFLNNSIYGKYSKYGGAIYNHLGELSIFNSKFINNSLQGNWTSGGAIYNFNGFLTLFNSSIVNTTLNPSYHSLGGAICIWNGRNSYIINSTISGNRINGNTIFGSAIANKGVLLEIINSTISDNYANGTSVENSTVYNMNGIYNCENSIFENNTIKTVRSNILSCIEDQLILSNAFDTDSWGDLPSSYDLRDLGWVTSIKNQNPGKDCWAFAIYAALESYLLKYDNVSYDFSENNMKNSMYVNGVNGTDWTGGGNHIMAFAYLLRGSGPVNESLDPFDASSTHSPEDLEISKYITGFKYIPLRLNYLDNSQIKYAILQYGALYTSVDSTHFRNNGTSYSNSSSINNHAVAIVGWDDNYSASNFETSPPGNGAWIIKNSWGTDKGQNGYYYVSYYDSTFPGVTDQFGAIAISSVDNISEYKSIYQYDMVGNSFESIGYNSHTAWFANQFVADSNNPLKAFGLYTFGSSSYLVNVTVNGISKLVQEGNLVGAGYHTVKLDSLVDLSKGDIFKITVRLTTPDSLFPIAIESYRTDYSTKVTAELNQSFISPDGISWYDMAKDTTVVKFYQDLTKISLKHTNVCLKAYTEYADDLSLEIKSNVSFFLGGDLISFNITISNNGDSSGEINISSILENSVEIVLYEKTKGSFDELTRIWTIDNLDNGESETLNLILRFNECKSFVNTSAYANSLSYSSNKNISNWIAVYDASSTEFLNISKITTKVESGFPVSITLLDAYRNPLTNKNIILSLLSSDNDFSMGAVDLNTNDGSAKFALNLPYGNYKFLVYFEGEGFYAPSRTTFEVNVKKTNTQIFASNLTTNAVVVAVDGKAGKYLKITLKDNDGNLLANKRIVFTLNNKEYSKTTNDKGIASLQINLAKAGTYSVKISFPGDNKFFSSSKIVKVSVKRQSLSLKVSNKKYRLKTKNKYLTATLKNSKGKRIRNKKIIFTINGKKYTAKTNSKGIAKVNVSLSKRKTYKFTVRFAGDKSYKAITKTAKAVIK